MRVIVKNITGEIIKRKGANNYSVRVSLPPDKSCNRWHWSKSKKICGNKNKARAELVKYGNALFEERNRKVLLFSELCEKFTNNRIALDKVQEITIKRNRPTYRHLCSVLGDTRIDKIDVCMIENAYVVLRKKGLSKNNIYTCHKKLKQVLKYAFNNDFVKCNAAIKIDDIKKPRMDPDKKESQTFTANLIKKLVVNLQKDGLTAYTVPLWIALSTGMRLGEILGLRWSDINFETKSLKIVRQLSQGKKIKAPKTFKSRRVVVLDDKLIDILISWQKIQKDQSQELTVVWDESVPVCATQLNEYFNRDNYSKWRQKYFVKCGIAKWTHSKKVRDSKGELVNKYWGYVGPTFHSLRHYHATVLVGAGLDPKTVQERLGHEDVHTTLQIYADAQKENASKAIKAIDDMYASISS